MRRDIEEIIIFIFVLVLIGGLGYYAMNSEKTINEISANQITPTDQSNTTDPSDQSNTTDPSDQSNTENIVRLSDIQIEQTLLEEADYLTKTLYYGTYMIFGSESQKVGYAKINGSIDTISSNEIYFTSTTYNHMDRSIDDNIDSAITMSSTTFNALPPYEFIQEETKVIQYGNEIIIITKRVGDKYISTTYRNSEILGIDTNDCTIPNYGLQDLLVPAYILSELDAGESNIFPFKSYSMNSGSESVDSVVLVKSQDHLVDGNKIKSYTFGLYIDDIYIEVMRDEYGNEILYDYDAYELRIENKSQAKDIDYTADLLSFGTFDMIPTKPETDYDTTQGKLAVVYEIHGEYNDIFIEDNHQEVFEESGKKYIKSHNFNMHTSSNQSEIDSLLSYSDARYPINDSEIIYLANSVINSEQKDSLKINDLLEFVFNYVEYSYDQKWHHNVYDIIKSKKGVCADNAYLFNVLTRSLGIPSREVGGLAYSWSEQRWGLHAWNEVYINNQWYFVDPTWGGAWQVPLKFFTKNYLITAPHLKTKDSVNQLSSKFSLSISSIILEDGTEVNFIID